MSATAVHAGPVGVPSLDELVEHPELVAELPAEVASALAGQAIAAFVALLPATASLPRAPSASEPSRPEFLDARAVAQVLGVSVSWVEKHVADLPPRRSLCGAPRWLRSDLEKWIKARPAYGDVA